MIDPKMNGMVNGISETRPRTFTPKDAARAAELRSEILRLRAEFEAAAKPFTDELAQIERRYAPQYISRNAA